MNISLTDQLIQNKALAEKEIPTLDWENASFDDYIGLLTHIADNHLKDLRAHDFGVIVGKKLQEKLKKTISPIDDESGPLSGASIKKLEGKINFVTQSVESTRVVYDAYTKLANALHVYNLGTLGMNEEETREGLGQTADILKAVVTPVTPEKPKNKGVFGRFFR